MLIDQSISRTTYLQKLKSCLNTSSIKLITGMRWSGKTSLIMKFIQELQFLGIDDSQILYIDFDLQYFSEMTTSDILLYICERSISDRKQYLFFDEFQQIDNWENIVLELLAEDNYEIFIISSNASVVFSKLFTDYPILFTEIRIYPLSFLEYLENLGYRTCKSCDALGQEEYTVLNSMGHICDKNILFHNYTHSGSLPIAKAIASAPQLKTLVFDGILSSIILKDIIERKILPGQHNVLDPALLRRLLSFLSAHVGSGMSANFIGKNINHNNELTNSNIQHKPSTHTILAYQRLLAESYLFYDISYHDIMSKHTLKSPKKYYIADPSILYHLLGNHGISDALVFENVIFIELLRRGYHVTCGKAGKQHIDFIAHRNDKTKLIQFIGSHESMAAILKKINTLKEIIDEGEKVVITMQRELIETWPLDISVFSALDFLLDS